MGFPYRSYDVALRLARAASPLLDRGDSKLARGIRGRVDAAGRLAGWARSNREADRPLAWFHAPSVGEGLQARSVLADVVVERGDLQTAYTHFSPSAVGLARELGADVAGYLPWDTLPESVRVLEALRPDLLAFTKTEVWPTLARAAERRGTPVVLIAATLPPDAGRLGFPGRMVLRPAFERLDHVYAISGDDGERFRRLGVPADRIEVTGDPAVDSAHQRLRSADPEAAWVVPFRTPDRPTLVAGSTWEPDEAVVVRAASRARSGIPGLRLVIAPHEPTGERLAALEERLRREGWRTARLADVEARGEAGDADAVLVDRVGVLAQLYTVGRAAYVGGGFHADGLHSVLEPAAAGRPVAFGPRHLNARAAADLLERGAAREVADALDLARTMQRWIGDGEAEDVGTRAKQYIERHAGAARRTAGRLAALLPPPAAGADPGAAGGPDARTTTGEAP